MDPELSPCWEALWLPVLFAQLHRRRYWLAIVGSVVALLPYTLTWPLGLGAGVSALITLLRPDALSGIPAGTVVG